MVLRNPEVYSSSSPAKGKLKKVALLTLTALYVTLRLWFPDSAFPSRISLTLILAWFPYKRTWKLEKWGRRNSSVLALESLPPLEPLCPRSELVPATLAIYNSGFLLCFQVWNMLQRRMYLASPLRSSSVDILFSLLIFVAVNTFRDTCDNHPMVWKREIQVLLSIL